MSLPEDLNEYLDRMLDEGITELSSPNPEVRLVAPQQITWGYVGGFFDADGSVTYHIGRYVISVRLYFGQRYRPILEGIRDFFRTKDISDMEIYFTPTENYINISRPDLVLRVAKELYPYVVIRIRQLGAVIDYLGDRITADRFVEIMNEEAMAGRWAGFIRPSPDIPYTRSEGWAIWRRERLRVAEYARERLRAVRARRRIV